MQPLRVTIVCNQVIPYRTPVFDSLAAQTGIDLQVVYLSKREKNREWEVARPRHDHLMLPSWSTYVSSRDWPIHLHRGLAEALNKRNPDVVVTMGYDSPGFWQAAYWAMRHGAGRVLYMGSTAMSSRTKVGPIALLRRRFVSEMHAFLAYGSWARDYLLALGANWEDIFVGINTVDVGTVARSVDAAEPIARRAAHELLYVGQLIRRKGVHVLIDALALLGGASDWRLHIAGSGPEEPALRAQIAVLGLESRVIFHGYKQTPELAPIMAGCDILVMPSQSEVWGLVVNEALAAGLFVVAGQTAGAVPDLLRDGINGYATDANHPRKLATTLARAMAAPKDRMAIRASVLPYTPQFTADRLGEAIRHAAVRAARSPHAEAAGSVSPHRLSVP